MSIIPVLKRVREASKELVSLSDKKRNEVLHGIADKLEGNLQLILDANAKDCERMDSENPKYDRLLLNEERLMGVAKGLREVSKLPSPLGITFEEREIEQGMKLRKVAAPLGVVGIIYEARPNVTYDVFALAFKAGNACVLKGGKDAQDSNEATIALIKSVLKEHGVDEGVVELLPNDHDKVAELFKASDYVDVVIPRGSRKLIDFVRENAEVPVIETGAGVVHIYFDESGDRDKAREIVFNAKTTRPSVCNSLDTLLLHGSRLEDLPFIMERLPEFKVEVFADEKCFEVLSGSYPDALLKKASEEHFGTEFLSLKMSVRLVDDMDEALQHISNNSSKHTESIIAENKDVISRYYQQVDAACVFSNCSTRFSDGFVFGLGAEVGISTQKLHARGPMGLSALTTYKWIVEGDGQVR